MTYNRKVGNNVINTTFEVLDVPNRSGILFHMGNTVDDTKGCILVASYYGVLNSLPAVLHSYAAFTGAFLDVFRKEKSFPLEIKWSTQT